MNSPFHPVHPRPPVDLEENLLCPCCRYNLRGLPQDRCPECGRAFDRAELLRRAACGTATSRLLADRRLWRLIPMALFQPARIGRDLLPEAGKGDAWRFVWLTRALVPLSLTLSATFGMFVAHPSWLFSGFFVACFPSIILGFIIVSLAGCAEMLVAGMLMLLVRPRRNVNPEPPIFWLQLCWCFSAHLPVSCLLVPLAASLISRLSGTTPMLALTPPAGLMVGWWWCLGRAVAVRGEECPGKWIAILAIPAAGLLPLSVFPLIRWLFIALM